MLIRFIPPRFGEYRLLQRLPPARILSWLWWRQLVAAPASGDLYLARDGRDNKVVVKVLGPVGPDEKLDERVAARCRSLDELPPTQVPRHRLTRCHGRQAVEMKRLSEPRLVDRLRRHKAIAPRRAAKIVNNVAEVLANAAANGVFHGRLDLSRVHVRPDDSVIVAGWMRSAGVELPGRCTAPERRDSSDDPVDGRADVFSLGCMLRQMIMPAVADRAAPTTVAPVPDAICEVLERATQPDPMARYATPFDFSQAVLRALPQARPNFVDHGAEPYISPPPLPRRVTRRRRATGAVVLLMSVGLIGLAAQDPHGGADAFSEPVGREPSAVVVAADGRVFVGNFADGSVTIIGPGTDPTTLPVGVQPSDLAFDQQADLLYVSDLASDTVHVVDARDDRPAGDLPVPRGPRGLAVAADGTVLVASGADGAVALVPRGASAPSAVIHVDGRPVAVVTAPTPGRAFVLTHAPGAVVELNVATGEVVGRPVMLPDSIDPDSLVAAPNGSVYVADAASGTVWSLDFGSPQVTHMVPMPLPVSGGVGGIALDRKGRFLYVAGRRPDGLYVIDLAVRPSPRAVLERPLSFSPDRLALTPDSGEVLLTDERDRTLVRAPVGPQPP